MLAIWLLLCTQANLELIIIVWSCPLEDVSWLFSTKLEKFSLYEEDIIDCTSMLIFVQQECFNRGINSAIIGATLDFFRIFPRRRKTLRFPTIAGNDKCRSFAPPFTLSQLPPSRPWRTHQTILFSMFVAPLKSVHAIQYVERKHERKNRDANDICD